MKIFYDVDPWDVYDLGITRFRIYMIGLAAQEGSAWRLARSDRNKPAPTANKAAVDASRAVERARSARELDAQYHAIDLALGGVNG